MIEQEPLQFIIEAVRCIVGGPILLLTWMGSLVGVYAVRIVLGEVTAAGKDGSI